MKLHYASISFRIKIFISFSFALHRIAQNPLETCRFLLIFFSLSRSFHNRNFLKRASERERKKVLIIALCFGLFKKSFFLCATFLFLTYSSFFYFFLFFIVRMNLQKFMIHNEQLFPFFKTTIITKNDVVVVGQQNASQLRIIIVIIEKKVMRGSKKSLMCIFAINLKKKLKFFSNLSLFSRLHSVLSNLSFF